RSGHPIAAPAVVPGQHSEQHQAYENVRPQTPHVFAEDVANHRFLLADFASATTIARNVKLRAAISRTPVNRRSISTRVRASSYAESVNRTTAADCSAFSHAAGRSSGIAAGASRVISISRNRSPSAA